ncbi:MAG TPA: phosphoribosylformylglycinamidine synthase subunit PurS [Kofleriaceae bacterium]|nr:phosphoribosylformylglycinamidine synthase subunit PurS [Kofleriaceae bacterium]
MHVKVTVNLKPGILDPQGQAVAESLSRLGYGEVRGVRIGKVVDIDLDESDRARARARVAEMCERLIANGVIETFSIELLEA